MTSIINICLGVLGTAITALATWGVERLIAWLNIKIKNDRANTYMNNAIQIVTSVVKCTFQSYVESIKGTDLWREESQNIALNKAITQAKQLLPKKIEEFLIENYGDLTEWLTSEIEAKIYELKNNKDATSKEGN